MAKKINKLSGTICLSKGGSYLKVEPKQMHSSGLSYPFTVPLKSEITFTEENDVKLNHFFDYSEADYPMGNLRKIYKNYPEQRRILSAIEQGVSLIAKLIADRGIEKRRIKIEIASDKEIEKCKYKRTGKPTTYKNLSYVPHKKRLTE